MDRTDRQSIWSKTVQIPGREPLPGDLQTEAVVIGGGLAGLLTAYFLQKRGVETVVVEAARIGSGQTANTTAKITGQHGAIYSKLLKDYGPQEAGRYAKAQQSAVTSYGQLIEEEHISCHFKRVSSYLYSKENASMLKSELSAAQKAGIPAYYAKETPLPFDVAGAVCFEGQAQFHPLEFLKAISDKLTIYENTKVLKVHGHCVKTEHGKIRAKHIVFATHYPFPIVPGFYFLRQHQERSYVAALSGIPKWEGMFYSTEKDGLSFRWYEDLLLVGGGGHRTGEIGENCGFAQLFAKIRQIYPEAEIVAKWSAQDCMPHDGLPFIGHFSQIRPDWYVATGFKKWGMTEAMLSARIISDKICRESNPYEGLFTPQRFHYQASKENLREDIRISSAGLMKGFFQVPFHRELARCPHMGCALKWNAQEKTWDCPCHGSRFDSQGGLLDNPAQRGQIKVPSRK